MFIYTSHIPTNNYTFTCKLFTSKYAHSPFQAQGGETGGLESLEPSESIKMKKTL